MIRLIIEAIVVGIMTVVIGVLYSALAMGKKESKKFQHWDSIVVTMFAIGVTIHLLCEGTGINRWYCTNGHACK